MQQELYVMKSGFKKVFKEGILDKNKLKKLLEMANISLNDLETQKFSFSQNLLIFLKKQGEILIYSNPQTEIKVYYQEIDYLKEVSIRMRWLDKFGDHSLHIVKNQNMYSINYLSEKEDMKIKVSEQGRKNWKLNFSFDFSNNEKKVDFTISKKIKETLPEPYFLKIKKQMQKIAIEPDKAREILEDFIITIKEENYMEVNLEEKMKNKKQLIREEIIGSITNSLVQNEKYRIAKQRNFKKAEETWNIVVFNEEENYEIETKEDMVTIKTYKKLDKEVLKLKLLYETTENVEYYIEDKEIIEIKVKRNELTNILKKIISTNETKAKELYYSKKLKI